jgi:RNA polymerase-binding transcription factor DksA
MSLHEETRSASPIPAQSGKSMSVQEAQKALRHFWDQAQKKYGEENSSSLDKHEQQQLQEIETALWKALRSCAEKNLQD